MLRYKLIRARMLFKSANYPSPNSKKREQLTSIDLLNMRYRQPHLIPIYGRSSCLQRITLKVNRLQILLLSQLALDLVEVR